MGSLSTHSSFEPLFLVVGAGSRGNTYAHAVNTSTKGKIGAIAEIDPFKRAEFGRKYIWGDRKPKPDEFFSSCEEFISYETKKRSTSVHGRTTSTEEENLSEGRITGVFICTLDDTHAPIIQALAPLNLHIMCEKPLALSLSDCLTIKSTLEQYPERIYSIGHVLRYSPHNILLRKLLCEQQVIGDVVSIEHTEPVGWWHFSHSFVRGNWRRSAPDAGSLLTKSCHDIDFLLWLLCSPSPLTGEKPHLPSTVLSTGTLSTFRRARKPKEAGKTTNCLDCKAESSCIYSAKKFYRDIHLRKEQNTGWPLKIVVPEIEDVVQTKGWSAAETVLMDKLSENWDENTPDEAVKARSWYGRCVYEADNDVCDEQSVIISWDSDGVEGQGEYGRGRKHALFHMTYPTEAQCQRRGRIYGTLGEITYDSRTINVHTFADGQTATHVLPKQAPEVEKSHGGGDWGLTGAFVNAIIASDTKAMSVNDAQWQYIGCDLEEIVRSHALVFAAEEARKRKVVVDFLQWEKEKYAALSKD